MAAASSAPRGLTAKLISHGIVKTRRQAELVLLAGAMVCIYFTFRVALYDDRPLPRPEESPNYEPPALRN